MIASLYGVGGCSSLGLSGDAAIGNGCWWGINQRRIKRIRMESRSMVWTERAVKRLCSLWSKGVPAREIGEKLGGISRNAVIGKAHRLGLSKQVGTGDAENTPAIIRAEDLTEKMCRWPIGHPGDDDFRFCGEPSIPTRPYCGEHCVQAYRGRSEEAA